MLAAVVMTGLLTAQGLMAAPKTATCLVCKVMKGETEEEPISPTYS
jgi:hypothetical protein